MNYQLLKGMSLKLREDSYNSMVWSQDYCDLRSGRLDDP